MKSINCSTTTTHPIILRYVPELNPTLCTVLMLDINYFLPSNMKKTVHHKALRKLGLENKVVSKTKTTAELVRKLFLQI